MSKPGLIAAIVSALCSLLIVLCLLTMTAAAQDRYFASERRAGYVRNVRGLDDNGKSTAIFNVNTEIDLQINDDVIIINSVSYFFEGQYQLLGGPLHMMVEVELPTMTVPRSPEETKIAVEPTGRMFGTYFNKPFEREILFDPGRNRYWIDIDFDSVSVEDKFVGQELFFKLDLGTGCLFRQFAVFVGQGPNGQPPSYSNLQRVPTSKEIATYLPGDADLDGHVDFEDFLALSDSFGGRGTWGHGDFNQDFDVDFDDFLIQSGNFGNSRNVVVVPEPPVWHSRVWAAAYMCWIAWCHMGYRNQARE